ncbi:hypothetical protein [Micromonospora sp. DT31]|uniref:hypothetical protein n=1 Tax=Micromonospora sp. DT31 TaxID=3393434 RepID=UPI003CF4BBF0
MGAEVKSMSFSVDDGRPAYHVDDPRCVALGVWLITDIRNSFFACLDALALIDDALHGRPSMGKWEGEGFDIHVAADRVVLRNIWLDGQRGEYPVPEVRDALERYWHFLAGLPASPRVTRVHRRDLPAIQADLLDWEETWHRPHPYRGRLF